MVEEAITKVHVVKTIGSRLAHNRARLGVIDSWGWNINIRVRNVHPAGEKRWVLRPIEQIGGGSYAELRRRVVKGCVG